jgi:hypothetical protein
MKRALTLLLACLSASAAAAQPAPSAPARLTMGDPRAEHVNVTLAGRGPSRALVVETRRVGAPGSRLRLSVDRRRPFLSQILDADQCRFDDFGSVCTVSFPRGSASYRNAVAAFRTGRVARVEIENAGNMAMARNVSLATFARALARRRG